jgi:hypothetical protein
VSSEWLQGALVGQQRPSKQSHIAMAYAAVPSSSSQHRCAGWPCMHRPPTHPLQPCAITTQLHPPCGAAGAAAAAVVLHCHRCATNAAAVAAAAATVAAHAELPLLQPLLAVPQIGARA